jgi:hypothetical protein
MHFGCRRIGAWFVFAIAFSIAAPGFGAPASLPLGARACGTNQAQDDAEDEVANVGNTDAPQIHLLRKSTRPVRLAAPLNHSASSLSRRAPASFRAFGSPSRLCALLCRCNC